MIELKYINQRLETINKLLSLPQFLTLNEIQSLKREFLELNRKKQKFIKKNK